MAEKENGDFDFSLENMSSDKITGDEEIDALLTNSVTDENKGVSSDTLEDDFIDFNDFSIDDLDTALSKYGDKSEDENISDAVSVVDDYSSPSISQNLAQNERNVQEGKDESSVLPSEVIPSTVNVEEDEEQTVSVDKDNDEYSQKNIDEARLGNLVWYDGTLGEKVYEISLDNMPEFLDYDSEIKTIHVNIESPYGWNVFFENGVFMNLMDIKEYQERHGSLPGHNGKIIYGNRMSSFEKIERIVVYSKPRYFAYSPKI